MFDDFTKHRVLQPFFKEPTTKHQLREISRETEISLPTVRDYVNELAEEDFLEKVEEGTYPGYKASKSERFKLYKKLEKVRKLHETGLVEEIEKKFHPNSIVLFGSAANGEDTEESDIDILIVAGEKEFDTTEYEGAFNREINLQFMTEDELAANTEFANSAANGITLKGFLKVKR
ncbi:MAG: nucleotidyltransferase domain-containing protein [Candidatus Nanohaloarchaea archaeon]